MSATNISSVKLGKDAAADKPQEQKPKPEKPDEQQYLANLAKAEKEHAIAQEKVVCQH
jgi:hypothetical protein